MPFYDKLGIPQNNNSSKRIAASATTANVSTPSDQIVNRDYCERIIITAASSAAPGAVTLFDGSTAIFVHTFPSAVTELVVVYDIGLVATSTAGFNVTTGTSVSCVVIGRF